MLDISDIYQIIKQSGKEGVIQSEILKFYNGHSSNFYKKIDWLVRNDLIFRVEVKYNGHNTFKVFSQKLNISADSVLDCPCFFCLEHLCSQPRKVSPKTCKELESYILKLVS